MGSGQIRKLQVHRKKKTQNVARRDQGKLYGPKNVAEGKVENIGAKGSDQYEEPPPPGIQNHDVGGRPYSNWSQVSQWKSVIN